MYLTLMLTHFQTLYLYYNYMYVAYSRSHIMHTYIYIYMPHTHCYSLSLEEGNVKEGGIEVDKLEQVHFDGEAVLVFSLSTVEL